MRLRIATVSGKGYHDNSLARNTVSENIREGMFTWHSSGNSIVYSDVSSNYLHGIHVSRSDGTVISDNTVFSRCGPCLHVIRYLAYKKGLFNAERD